MASYLAEVVGFLLLLAFTYHYVWPVLKKLMDSQVAAIRSSLSSADAARDNGERQLAEARTALEAAHLEAAVIVERAEETSAQLLLEGERRGQEGYERLVASAAAEAEFERQRGREEVSREIGLIVMAATEQVVAAEIDASLQRAFISETIDAAEAMA
jgi:F-type H+-transporting ATPase subunit b